MSGTNSSQGNPGPDSASCGLVSWPVRRRDEGADERCPRHWSRHATAPWHVLSGADASRQLRVDPGVGLTHAEAQARLAKFGPNQLTARRGRPAWVKLLQQFSQALVSILLAATVVSAALGEWVDAAVIFGVVLVNAIVGFVQESKAEKAIEALAQMVRTDATVRRDGRKQRVPAADLVPGDLVLLRSGDRVPADSRLLEVRSLQVEEAAVEEGRNVFDNLKRFITWTLPTNGGEALLILAAVFFGTALPILPVQLLWINMTTALLLGLTLVFETKEAGLMARPPRSPAEPLLTRALLWRITLVSLLMLAGGFALFEREELRGAPLAEARTVVVNVIVTVEMFYLLNCRSLTRPLFKLGLFTNRWLIGGVAAMLAAQLLFTYAPVMNKLFHSAPIGAEAWLLIIAVGLIVFVAIEIMKWRAARTTGGAP